MKFLSGAVYFVGLIFSSFMMYLLVMCMLFEYISVKHLIVDSLHYLKIISFTSQDLPGTTLVDNFLTKIISGKYSFIYYALQGTMIFIGINVLVYITGVWKIFSKIIDGYSGYKIIGTNDPLKQKLFNVLGEIQNNAKSKLNIDLPDYHKFDFEIQDGDEDIDFHITSTQVLRPTTKMLSYLKSNNKRDNDIFRAVVAHEIGHFVNKDTEFNQFRTGTSMITCMIQSIFHKISPKKLKDKIFGYGATLTLEGGCLGTIVALPFLFIALFLWIVLLPGVICLWIDEKITYYVLNPLGSLTGRQKEYNADSFAVKIGYGQGLFDLFIELDKLYGTGSGGFSWQRFFQESHPTNYARQKNINHVMNNMRNP